MTAIADAPMKTKTILQTFLTILVTDRPKLDCLR